MPITVDEVGDAGVVSALKALGNEGRLKLVVHLCRQTPPPEELGDPESIEEDPRWVRFGEISERIGLPEGNLSYHLAVLGEAGLIERTRRGRGTYIRLRRFRVRDLAEVFAELHEPPGDS